MDIQSLKQHYGIVAQDEKVNKALHTAVQIAPTDLSVLIQGESGVGKEVIPRIIHDCSHRRSKRYIAINCGSIPEGTIDSELFGHEKGSFTGAVGEREGYFGTADGGTLFLDEIGELPMSTQARLLRVLETGEYIRVGNSIPRRTDVRIIAATNVNIPHAIREGRFREDLYYRLCTININMPPLRERGRDSVLLFKKFSLDIADRYKIPMPLRLTPEAEEVITTYKWPGNVRQLKNVAEQISILSTERIVTPKILQEYGVVSNQDISTAITCQNMSGSHSPNEWEKEIKMLVSAILNLRREVDEIKSQLQFGTHSNSQTNTPTHPVSYLPAVSSVSSVPMPITPHIEPGTPHRNATDFEIQTAEEVVDRDDLNLANIEKRVIMKALQRNRYLRKYAADELGISQRTLYRKIKDYGLEDIIP